jgi:hypothetical protein
MKRRGINRAKYLKQQTILRQLRDQSNAFSADSNDPIPAATEIEDRHVHHQHRISHFRPATKGCPPTAAGAGPATVDTQFQTGWLALHLITRVILQSHGVECVRAQFACNLETVIALESHDRVSRLRPENAVDLSAIVTFAC